MGSYDLEEWSERIYLNLPDTGMTTSGQVLTWLRYNPKYLNAAFDTTYAFNGSGIEPTITPNHSGFYEELFYCDLYRRQAVKFVGADAFDLDLVESELTNQSRQRFVSRNERAKTYRSLANDCSARLDQLAEDLTSADSTSPLSAQILFGDRANMKYGGDCYCPLQGSFTAHNTIWSKFYSYS